MTRPSVLYPYGAVRICGVHLWTERFLFDAEIEPTDDPCEFVVRPENVRAERAEWWRRWLWAAVGRPYSAWVYR